MNLLKYSNGYGHLVMSITTLFIALIIVIAPSTDASTKAVGVGMMLTVSGAWFVPGAARQMAQASSDQGVADQENDKAQ